MIKMNAYIVRDFLPERLLLQIFNPSLFHDNSAIASMRNSCRCAKSKVHFGNITGHPTVSAWHRVAALLLVSHPRTPQLTGNSIDANPSSAPNSVAPT